MEFDTLYKTTSANKLYVWNINVIEENDKVFEISSHGEEGGKIITHKKEITIPKGNKTLVQQAIQDATRKYINKRDKDGYIPNKNNILTTTVVRPMLAHTFTFESIGKRGKNIQFPCYVQPKLDGIRCMAYLDNNGSVIMESRKGVPLHFMDNIRTEIGRILTATPHVCLDGELYTHDLPFEVISGIVRLKDTKKITNAQKEHIEKLKYCVYDCIDKNNLEAPFIDRYNLIRNAVANPPVIQVLTQTINHPNVIEEKHNEYVALGYEGIMLRNVTSKYEIDKRSKDLQKFKKFKEEEFRITGFHEGSGDDKGCVIWECITTNGKEFSVEPVGTREHRKKLFNRASTFITCFLTVKFFEYTKDGVPRFPKGKDIRNGY